MKTLPATSSGRLTTIVLALLVFFGVLSMSTPSEAKIVTTVYSEGFEKGIPYDWYYYGYWYSSSAGYSDYNGAAMFDFYNYGYGDLNTPTFDLSAYNTPDTKVFIEFDMWFEMDAYNYYYGDDYMYFYGYDQQNGNFANLATYYTNTDYTFDNSGDWYYYYEPDPSPKFWRHIKMEIPASLLTSSVYFWFSGSYGQAGGGFGIDNFTINAEQPLNISSTPSLLDFGTISIGSPSSVQNITIDNPNPYPLSISSINKTGANQSEFQFVGTLPTFIPAYSSATVSVRFVPTSNGDKYAQVTISNNSDNMPTITVSLLGKAVGPGIEIIPIGSVNTSTRMFRKTRTTLGDTLNQSFLVKNMGSGTLTVSTSSFINGDNPGSYTITRYPKFPLGPEVTDTMTIRFIPTQEGSLPARANILSNAYNGTQTIDLSGLGIIPRIVIKPSEMLTFDSVAIGTNECKKIWIYNPGSDTLRILNDYLASADGDFSYNGLPRVNGVAKIAPNDSASVEVCVTPLQNGTRRARLRFTTNIPFTFEGSGDGNGGYSSRRDTSAKAIEIWANGVPLDKTIIALGEFNDGIIGEEVSSTATVTNAGSEKIVINTPVFSGAQAGSFKATKANFPLEIAPGTSISFTVTASPVVRGENSAVMSIPISGADLQYVNATDIKVNGLLASSTANTPVLGYDKLFVGEESSLTFTVTNDGDIDQSFTASVSGKDFSLVSDASSGVVMPGSSVVYTVKYAPTSKGTSTGAVTVKGAHVTDMTVSLTGTSDVKPVTQSVKGEVTEKGFILSQNTPNPASGSTMFNFTLPVGTDIQIKLVDQTGKTIRGLVSGYYTAGEHELIVNTSDIVSGTYLYILESEGITLIRRMVVQK